MTKIEELQKHVDTLKAKEEAARKALQDFAAHKQAFESWIQVELEIDPKRGEILMPEILLLWNKKHGQSPQHS